MKNVLSYLLTVKTTDHLGDHCKSLRDEAFGRIDEEELPNLVSKGSCVSIDVRLKRLIASVSTRPFQFQIQHAVLQTGGRIKIRQPTRARRFGTEAMERPEFTRDGTLTLE